MKILIALHKCMDLGGIINHTEQLIGGLKDLGHTVDFKEFVWANVAHPVNSEGNWKVGPSGIPYDQGKGWKFRKADRIPYKGYQGVKVAQDFMSQFDLVVWTVPVPSVNKLNEGNADWIHLYDLPPSVIQVAFSHDGNAEAGYPHIIAIQEKLSGLACVHDCALNATGHVAVPRALVLNPQHNPVRFQDVDWDHKRPGFVNMQTFKAWKRVHELVEAIAYMPPKRAGELREVAGDGIERRYMKSEEKCKPQYFHADGRKFWDAALDNGMVAHDYWQDDEVEQHLWDARVLVDPSWSKKYAAKGGHWNRVVVDAMIRGAIPVAREMGMGNSLFTAGENYIAIPQDASPKLYGDIILDASHMSSQAARRFHEANVPLLGLFDRKKVAQSLLELAWHETPDLVQGTTPKDIQKKAEDICFNHYGILI